MTLLHWIEHLPNLRFHHKRIQISTPLIVSHGYFSFLCLNIKQLKSQQFFLPVLSLRKFPSIFSLYWAPHLCCRDAEMLRKALQEANLMFLMLPHPRWAACWLCPSWWRRRASGSGTPYSGRGSGGGGGGGWITWSCSLYPDAPGRLDTFYYF